MGEWLVEPRRFRLHHLVWIVAGIAGLVFGWWLAVRFRG
jgi:hypothetical protein